MQASPSTAPTPSERQRMIDQKRSMVWTAVLSRMIDGTRLLDNMPRNREELTDVDLEVLFSALTVAITDLYFCKECPPPIWSETAQVAMTTHLQALRPYKREMARFLQGELIVVDNRMLLCALDLVFTLLNIWELQELGKQQGDCQGK